MVCLTQLRAQPNQLDSGCLSNIMYTYRFMNVSEIQTKSYFQNFFSLLKYNIKYYSIYLRYLSIRLSQKTISVNSSMENLSKNIFKDKSRINYK